SVTPAGNLIHSESSAIATRIGRAKATTQKHKSSLHKSRTGFAFKRRATAVSSAVRSSKHQTAIAKSKTGSPNLKVDQFA
ncbi:MAG: hypothetical protein AAF939_21805, partial [Planctomycetota bacterium]